MGAPLPFIEEQLRGFRNAEEALAFFDTLDDSEVDTVVYDSELWELPYQRWPEGHWKTWILRCGRGVGKTYTGSSKINEVAEDRKKVGRGELAIVAPTYSDARHVCVEGPSGVLATCKPDFRPEWSPGNGQGVLVWPNGVKCRVFSADAIDRIRGSNLAFVWGDEVCYWPDFEESWKKAIFPAVRQGWKRVMLTTTPVPGTWLQELEKQLGSHLTTASSFDNIYADPEHLAHLRDLYDGTDAGEQELGGAYLNNDHRLLWVRDTIHRFRVNRVPWRDIIRTAIAVDPAVTSTKRSDEHGIMVGGVTAEGHVYVWKDASLERAGPHEWGEHVVDLYEEHEADVVVAEVNQGGDLVESNIRTFDPNISYKSVHAYKGKQVRAEPVSSVYKRGFVHHVGVLTELERQLCGWVPGSRKSPDRLDAVVYLVTELLGLDPRRKDKSQNKDLPFQQGMYAP